jgi:PAS domain-containing protein
MWWPDHRLPDLPVGQQYPARKNHLEPADSSLIDTLASSEAILRAFFTGLSQGVVLQSATGMLIDCNPAAESILGLTRKMMLGRTSVDPRWRAVHEDGTPFPGEDHPAMVTQPGVCVGSASTRTPCSQPRKACHLPWSPRFLTSPPSVLLMHS